ncbi:MAG: hypothetical protein DCC75_01745 [Proteobacteria bacterium]|nr:MAG: hypothetical protein DCC75_01745 [Pseudomonadota bacterium]
MYLNFNEGSGSQASDSSGGGNHGSLQGASWDGQGYFGGALAFDGVNDTVDVADSGSLDLSNGMTLEAWVKPVMAGSGRFETVIMKETGNNLAYTIYSRTDGTNQPARGEIVGSQGWVTAQNAQALPANTWRHLAVTFDGSALRLFLNGTQAAITNSPGTINQSSQPLRIGGNSVWGEYFQGVIDEVRIYNRALSAAEIQADMQNAGEPLPGTLFVAPAEGFTVSGPLGGPFAPTSKHYTLTNSGAEPIQFSAVPNQNWISASPASGALNPSASVNVAVSLQASASSFPIGTYSGSVAFTNTTNNEGNTSRQVTFNVYDPAGQHCSSITQRGITYTFSASHLCGQYVNGDWWVVGDPVVITSITPNFSGGRNGWAVNPVNDRDQAYDSRMGRFISPPQLPYQARPGDSVVKAVSVPDSDCSTYNGNCVLKTAVLTIESAPQPVDSFRPQFYGGRNTKEHYYEHDIQYNLLPNLPITANIAQYLPDRADIESRYNMPALETSSTVEVWMPNNLVPYGNTGGTNGRTWGCELAVWYSQMVYWLSLNRPLEEKKTTLLNLIQDGIDMCGAYRFMPDLSTYHGGGGNGAGRIGRCVFAATMLDAPVLKNFLQNGGLCGDPSEDNNRLWECSMYYRSPHDSDLALWGSPNDDLEVLWYGYTVDESWDRQSRDPMGFIDGGSTPGWSYGHICSLPTKYVALTVGLIPAMRPYFPNISNMENFGYRWAERGIHTQPDPCAPSMGRCVGGSRNNQTCTHALRTGQLSCPGGFCIAGVCENNHNQRCSYADVPELQGDREDAGFSNSCPSSQCIPDPDFFKVTYGPQQSNPSMCIFDQDARDGTGRFVDRHGLEANQSNRSDQFCEAMWSAYN